MPVNSTPHSILRRGLWSVADCDLRVLAHVPRELALALVSGIVTQNRDEVVRGLTEGDREAAEAVASEIPDLGPYAEVLRNRRRSGPPRRDTLNRIGWALHRAARFLDAFAPPACVEDPVLADRILDLSTKIAFLTDLVDGWRQPRAASRRRTG